MGNVDFLNIEYLLLRTYRFFTGFDFNVGVEEASAAAVSFFTQLTILGLSLAAIIFAAMVYVILRLIAVEHEVHERQHAHSHAHSNVHEEGETHEEERKNSRWERIVHLVNTESESDWRRAIIEADNMLGDVLIERGYIGENVGNLLRNSNPLQFRTLDLAWRAHKVRNDIAHRGEALQLSQRDARATVDLYARVFEEFGVI